MSRAKQRASRRRMPHYSRNARHPQSQWPKKATSKIVGRSHLCSRLSQTHWPPYTRARCRARPWTSTFALGRRHQAPSQRCLSADAAHFVPGLLGGIVKLISIGHVVRYVTSGYRNQDIADHPLAPAPPVDDPGSLSRACPERPAVGSPKAGERAFSPQAHRTHTLPRQPHRPARPSLALSPAQCWAAVASPAAGCKPHNAAACG